MGKLRSYDELKKEIENQTAGLGHITGEDIRKEAINWIRDGDKKIINAAKMGDGLAVIGLKSARESLKDLFDIKEGEI